MKRIWDKKGHLTDFGQSVMEKAERKVDEIIRSTGAKGREVLEIELVFLRAASYIGTMSRLREQAK